MDSGHVVTEPSTEHVNSAYMYFQHYVEFHNGYSFKIPPYLQNSKNKKKTTLSLKEYVPCMVISFNYEVNHLCMHYAIKS